jgi:anti-sigma factor RsiW
VNPQLHDEFVALCSLYYSSEISEEEWALLQIHMGYCDACHERFLEYQRITSDLIPAMAAVAASEFPDAPREFGRTLETAERRLMSQLGSPSERSEPPRHYRFRRRLPGPLIAACGLILACVFGVELARMKSRLDAKATQAPAQSRVIQATGVLSVQDEQQVLNRSQEQIATLEQQVRTADGRLKQASRSIAKVEEQLNSEQNADKQLSADKGRLSRQLAAAESELDSMRNSWASVGRDATQQAPDAAALETQVRELNAALDEKDIALNEKDRMLALDKDFLAHDRDIRDLIGARNLYIADIFDTNENGKTAKQFGRIFYTRNRSLIFYGFDLDSQMGHKQNVSFQVWGSGSDRLNPLSLACFIRTTVTNAGCSGCNDAKSLARLDMVFVTVEPPGGSSKPTGKQLLRAYLQIHPNHP